MIVLVPGVVSLTAFFIAVIAFVALTVTAFKISVFRGIFCLVIPFYVFYHAVKEYTEQGKRLFPILFIGGFLGGLFFQGLGWLVL